VKQAIFLDLKEKTLGFLHSHVTGEKGDSFINENKNSGLPGGFYFIHLLIFFMIMSESMEYF